MGPVALKGLVHHVMYVSSPSLSVSNVNLYSTLSLEWCAQDRCTWSVVSENVLGINWHQHVRNDEVRRLNKQPHLSAMVQSRRLSLFGHIARMPDETDTKQILTASPTGNWTRPLVRPRITWMKTIQQDLKSSNLNMDDAVDLAQNCPLWRLTSMFGATHS